MFYDETLELLKEGGPPVEYKTWMSGEYFSHKPAHSSLVFSESDVVPSHAAFNSLSQTKGVKQSVTTRMRALRSISESERSIEGVISEDEESVSSSHDEVDTGGEDSGISNIVRNYESNEEYHHEVVRRSSSVVNMNKGTLGISNQSSMLADLAAKATELGEKPSPPKESRKIASPKLTPSSSRKSSNIDKFLNLEDDMDTKAIRGDSFRSTSLSPESKRRLFKNRDKSLANLLSEEALKSPGQARRKVIEVKMNSDGGAIKIVDLAVDRSDSAVMPSPKSRLVKMQTSSDVIYKANSDKQLASVASVARTDHRQSF